MLKFAKLPEFSSLFPLNKPLTWRVAGRPQNQMVQNLKLQRWETKREKYFGLVEKQSSQVAQARQRQKGFTAEPLKAPDLTWLCGLASFIYISFYHLSAASCSCRL